MALRRKGTFTRDSARRIARQVRRMEARPDSPVVPQVAPGSDVPFQFRRFTLKDALSATHENPGGTAVAHLVTWNGQSGLYEVQTDIEFDVRDPSGDRYGIAYDEQKWDRFIGWCVKPFDLPEWEIVSLPIYQICNATVKGDVAEGASYVVDNVVPLFGASPVADSEEEVSVTNRYGDALDDNAAVSIEFNGATLAWQTGQITCPA